MRKGDSDTTQTAQEGKASGKVLVFLNGAFMGRHENGAMAFGIDISEKINAEPGENVLALRAQKVELFVNGKSVGTGERSYEFLHVFKNIEWKAGAVKAAGFDKEGIKLCETQKKKAGEPRSV